MEKTLEKPRTRPALLFSESGSLLGGGLATYANRLGDVCFWPFWTQGVMHVPSYRIKPMDKSSLEIHAE